MKRNKLSYTPREHKGAALAATTCFSRALYTASYIQYLRLYIVSYR